MSKKAQFIRWLVFVTLIVVIALAAECHTARAGTARYVFGYCKTDDGMLANVTVYIDRQIDGQWQTFSRSSTTNISGWWGVYVPTTGVARIRIRPVAPEEYRLYGVSIPTGGYQARYIKGVGIELPPPDGNAGNFGLLFVRESGPPPIPTSTPIHTPVPTATLQPSPTPTVFPDWEDWIDPSAGLENVVAQEALELVSHWIVHSGPIAWAAWEYGLGPFPVYGPFEIVYQTPSGEIYHLQATLYPRGHLVWRDMQEPSRVRITQVDKYSW